MQGRRTALTVILTPGERAILEQWQRSHTIRADTARRARMLLLLAQGETIAEVARVVGMSRHFVYKWVRRFQTEGVPGLVRRPYRRKSPGAE